MIFDQKAILIIAGALEEIDIDAQDLIKMCIILSVTEYIFELSIDELKSISYHKMWLLFNVPFILFIHPSFEGLVDMTQSQFALN